MTNNQATRRTKMPCPNNGLRYLLIDGLKDIYWVEKSILKILPQLISNSTSYELVEVLYAHQEVTRRQVRRLEKVFSFMDVKPISKKCLTMEGLIFEAEEMMNTTEEGVVLDAGIILLAQKVEHYEIATYGALASYAKKLDQHIAAELLLQSLSEEKETDLTLSEIAESAINIEVAELEEEPSQ